MPDRGAHSQPWPLGTDRSAPAREKANRQSTCTRTLASVEISSRAATSSPDLHPRAGFLSASSWRSKLTFPIIPHSPQLLCTLLLPAWPQQQPLCGDVRQGSPCASSPVHALADPVNIQ